MKRVVIVVAASIGVVAIAAVLAGLGAARAQAQPSTPAASQPAPATRVTLPAERARDASAGRLQKSLFVVVSTAQRPPAELKQHLPDHLKYLASLEASGELFMAGPLMNEDPQTWSGDGLLVYNADSFERAREIAAGDPLHASGMRSFTIRPWLLNDGRVNLSVTFSDQSVRLP